MNSNLIRTTTLAIVGLVVASASAGYDYRIKMTKGDFQSGVGGEFRVVVQNGPAGLLPDGPVFQTFCVERNETFHYNKVYEVQINTETVASGQQLNNGVAHLYQSFRDGSLSGYRLNGPRSERKADAEELQKLIWWMMGDGNGYDASTNKFWGALTAEFGLEDGDLASDAFNNDALGNVRIMNLRRNGNNHQDQLTLVPVPGAFVLGSFGLGFAGWIKRRMA